ncbi:hypothetical protein [Acinetobacter baumannii]|uniref:hypothetical protein n=1 Tax=Acinetobacter baumannii TaxID=470 RepID=UPI001A92F5E0|nr:hypothetical protein [Acinetobacter baumannii]MBO0650570.1 hypothetical protein [Acinetobacter baumannii]MCT9478782.1 hypothetical protein [Acinetobacter baumannii]MCZ3044596.1 hypothetical protein [Acinetobacter baumannii]HEN9559531.1 hypothetical protein [Acinetobacter baumannii]
MNYITKCTCQSVKVQQGLDNSHPDFKRQSKDGLVYAFNTIFNSNELEETYKILESSVMIPKIKIIEVIEMLENEVDTLEIALALCALVEMFDVVDIRS